MTDRSGPDADWRRDRIGAALAGTNPTVLARLPEALADIGDAQFLPGYCVLLVDEPGIDRLSDLPRPRRLAFLESVDRLGSAVEEVCRSLDPAFRRLNYEILGNTDAYLHCHVFARYEWEAPEHVGRPVWLYDPAEFYGPATALGPEHDELRSLLTAALRGEAAGAAWALAAGAPGALAAGAPGAPAARG